MRVAEEGLRRLWDFIGLWMGKEALKGCCERSWHGREGLSVLVSVGKQE